MKIRAWLLFAFLLAGTFTLATALQPRAIAWGRGSEADGLLPALLGDGRQILANHLFVQADVYFHNGYYPSVFDRGFAPTNAQHMAHEEDHTESAVAGQQEAEHEKAMNFLAPPLDCLESFGRRFAITRHTHLASGKEREILPWLRLSADLDPHRIETYTVAAFWLRRDLGKVKEAEQLLREGLAENPSSYEIRFELGRLYEENYHDRARAENNWRAALKRWMENEAGKPNPDVMALGQIVGRLARIEESEGHYAQAIDLLEMAIAHHATPHPEAVRQQIEKLQARLPGRQLQN